LGHRAWRFLWPLGYAAAAAVSLWIRAAIPITFGWSSVDDFLFARLAANLKAGNWLGAYDQFTLIKGMAYPAFIAAAAATHIPLKIAEHMAYLVAAAIACLIVQGFTRSRWLAFLLFIALALNPVLWADEFTRVLRDGLYISVALVLVPLAAMAFFPREHAPPVASIALMTSVGLVAGIFWMTREEGIWIAPAGMVLICIAAVREWRHVKGPRRVLRVPLRVVLRAAPAAFVFAAVVGGVAFENWKRYGVFEINEFKSQPFQAAYGSLLRIRHDNWRRYIEFPKDARERAYAVSPAARELYQELDGSSAEFWRKFGCDGESCDEIRSGFFIWAFWSAVGRNGHYSSAGEARAFYRRLAAEINAACESERIPCLPQRSTLAPPFRWQYVSETIAAVPRIGQHLLALGQGRIVSRPSFIPRENLEGVLQIVGPVATDDQANHTVQMRIARTIADTVAPLMPAATVVAIFGLLLAFLFADVRRRQAGLLVLMLTCGAAITGRLVLLAYLDVSSFGEGAASYITSATGLLVVFVVSGLYLSCLIVGETIQRAFRRRLCQTI
jgi:hypothetical protein